jgi:cell division protein FtsB
MSDFVCNNCNSNFSNLGNLNKHIRTSKKCGNKSDNDKKTNETNEIITLLREQFKTMEEMYKSKIKFLQDEVKELNKRIENNEKEYNKSLKTEKEKHKQEIKDLRDEFKSKKSKSPSPPRFAEGSKEKKSPSKKSPPSSSSYKDEDIKPFSKEELKEKILENIKFGKLYANNNLTKYYLIYDETKKYIWAYTMAQETTQVVFPLTRMTIVMRNKLKKFGFLLLDSDEEFEKRYNNCKDKRSIPTLIYEQKQMEEVKVSEIELTDNINDLCNKVIESKDNSRLDEYGIGDIPLYTLYKVKNEYKKWLDKMCEDERSESCDEKEFSDNKQKIKRIDELVSLVGYNFVNFNDDYMTKLYILLDEIELSSNDSLRSSDFNEDVIFLEHEE